MAGVKKTNYKTKAKPKYKAKPKPKVSINKSLVNLGKGFPKKMLMTHKYMETFLLTSTSGVFNTYHFCANGMGDPNLSGVGHQPMFHDQMAALYNHYVVIASKITYKVMNAASNTGLIGVVAFINDDTSVTPTSINAMMEQSSATKGFITYGSSDPVTLMNKWSAKKTFGGSVLANNDLKAVAGSNPTEQSVYTFAVQCLDNATTVAVYVEAIIEYVAIWIELKDMERS